VTRFILVGVGAGVLFAFMDALLNANPLAQRLLAAYKPVMKEKIDAVAGTLVDLIYGIVMAAIFLILYDSLSGETGLLKGLSFGVLVWFFRVVMSVATEWITREIPQTTLLYNLLGGLLEMLVLGAVYGLTLNPEIWL